MWKTLFNSLDLTISLVLFAQTRVRSVYRFYFTLLFTSAREVVLLAYLSDAKQLKNL